MIVSQLTTRKQFNFVATHIRQAIAIVDDVSQGYRLELALAPLLGELSDEQVFAVIGLVAEKFGYSCCCFNLGSDFCDPKDVSSALSQIQAADCLVTYDGAHILSSEHPLETEFRPYKFLSIYARAIDKVDVDAVLLDLADLINQRRPLSEIGFNRYLSKTGVKTKRKPSPKESGEKAAKTASSNKDRTERPSISARPSLARKKIVESEPASDQPAAQQKTSEHRVSPTYAVQVTNELFHNGNVEAWKNIIAGYYQKHPDCEISIYHKGEEILNLNTLFKWGKVRHGEAIMFRVKGVFADLAKLKRYLYEGASNRFEKFLQKEVNSTLRIF